MGATCILPVRIDCKIAEGYHTMLSTSCVSITLQDSLVNFNKSRYFFMTLR